MADYRLYCLDGAGGIGLAEWIEAADDDDAIARARRLKRDSQRCEIWRRTQLVAALDANELRRASNVTRNGDSLLGAPAAG